MTKSCIKCKKSLPVDEFYKRSASSDRLDNYCKKCRQCFTNNYYNKNVDAQRERVKQYQRDNQDKVAQTRSKRVSKMNEYQRKYKLARFHSEPLFKLICNLRRSTSMSFKGLRKDKKTIELLGCSLEEARVHLEASFSQGMSWLNYGKWHVDHIIPISSAKNKEQLEKLWHYSNLQPLWAKDNLSKSDKTNWMRKQS